MTTGLTQITIKLNGQPRQFTVSGEETLLHVLRPGIAVQQRLGRHDHSGRAEPALDCPRVNERLLQRMGTCACPIWPTQPLSAAPTPGQGC